MWPTCRPEPSPRPPCRAGRRSPRPDGHRPAGAMRWRVRAARALRYRRWPRHPSSCSRSGEPPPTLTVPAGRKIARVHRVLQIVVGLVGPELRHVRECVDDRVLQTVVHLLDLAHVDVLDRVAEVVETDRPARRIGEIDLEKRSASAPENTQYTASTSRRSWARYGP